MPAELTFLAALLLGFVGSSHCIGMCGGIAGATGAASIGSAAHRLAGRIADLLLYNAGRILSYITAGTMAATVGQIGLSILPAAVARGLALTVSIAFLFGLGLYLSGWWSFLPGLERIGSKFWQRIEPWGRRFLPIRHRYQAFLLGVVWGWLPCGLVYSALAWSAATGEPLTGALLMAGFGLGTLPTLLCLGAAGHLLQRLRRNRLFRQAAGVTLILLAATLFGLYEHNTHKHGRQPDDVLLRGPETEKVGPLKISAIQSYHRPSEFCVPAPPDHRTALT